MKTCNEKPAAERRRADRGVAGADRRPPSRRCRTQAEHALARARAFAEPLHRRRDAGHRREHAGACRRGGRHPQVDGRLARRCRRPATWSMPATHLNKPQEVIAKAFGENYAALAMETTKLVQVQQQRASAQVRPAGDDTARADRERAQDAAGVLARPARGACCGWRRACRRCAGTRPRKQPCPPSVAREALHVFAPLANRLGIWQIKWEMEDLAFRFLEPETYKQVARLLDEKRVEREQLRRAAARAAGGRAARRRASRRRCRAGPSTSTASSRRCAASRWTSTRCSTCARCA